MELSIPGALVGGFVATLVMTIDDALAGAAGITQMPPMERVTGSMISGNPESARRIGVRHPLDPDGHGGLRRRIRPLFLAVGSASWLVDLVIGLAHGAAVCLVFMPMMPATHPRMSSAPAAAATGHAGEVYLLARGPSDRSHWGAMTPVALLAGHAVYGVVTALIYGLFA